MITSRLIRVSGNLLRSFCRPTETLASMLATAGKDGDLDRVEAAYKAANSGRHGPIEIIQAIDYLRRDAQAEANLPSNLKQCLLHQAASALATLQKEEKTTENLARSCKLLFYLYTTASWKEGKVNHYLQTVIEPYRHHLASSDKKAERSTFSDNAYYLYLKSTLSSVDRCSAFADDSQELIVIMSAMHRLWRRMADLRIDCQRIKEQASHEELSLARVAVLKFLKRAAGLKTETDSDSKALWRVVKIIPASFFKPASSMDLETILRLLSLPATFSPLPADQMADLRRSVESHDYSEWHTSELAALMTALRQGWRDEDWQKDVSNSSKSQLDRQRLKQSQAGDDHQRTELRRKRLDKIWKLLEKRAQEDLSEGWKVTAEEFSEIVENMHWWIEANFRDCFGFKQSSPSWKASAAEETDLGKSNLTFTQNERHRVVRSVLGTLSQAVRRLVAMNQIDFNTAVGLLTILETVPESDSKMANQLQFTLAHSLVAGDFDVVRLRSLHRHFEHKKRGSRSLRKLMEAAVDGKPLTDIYKHFMEVKQAKIKVDGFRSASSDSDQSQ